MIRRVANRFAIPMVTIRVVIVLLVAFLAHGALAQTSALFQPAVAYNAGGIATESVAVTDVNKDGNQDLVVVIQNAPAGVPQSNGLVGVLLGNGDGTFQTSVTYDTGGNQPFSVAVADLNGDGNPDIAVANSCVIVGNTCPYTTVGILLGNGDGTFQPVVTYDPGVTESTAIAIADVNGDAKPDLVIAAIGNFPEELSVLFGNGDGTFQSAALFPTLFAPYAVAVADVNGDTRADIVTAGNGPAVGVLLGNGDGTFQPVVLYGSGVSVGGWPNSVAVADLNGDDKLDLAVANYPDSTTGVLLGNGDGTFQPVVLYGSGAPFAWSEAIADVNGDSKPDLIVGDFNGTVGVLLGNGDGTFQSALTYSVQGDATSVLAADVNSDGRPDLLVTNGNFFVSVLLNNSAPSDTSPPVITISATPKVLWPPNGKLVPVTVSGAITDMGSGVNAKTAAYAVKDEYGEVQPTGAITLGPGGNYSFTVLLQASRRGSDLDGRRYTINVRARDNAGNSGSKARAVTVPHAQEH
jgi:hypothetical protein